MSRLKRSPPSMSLRGKNEFGRRTFGAETPAHIESLFLTS